jgi:hypothetical protein
MCPYTYCRKFLVKNPLEKVFGNLLRICLESEKVFWTLIEPS